MGTISRTALAEKWGVSASYIDNLRQKGTLQSVGRGVFDEEQAEQARVNMDPGKRMAVETVRASGGQVGSKQNEGRISAPDLEVHDGGKAEKPPTDSPMLRARIVREVANAKRAELEYKKQAGELVSVSEVKSQVHTIVRVFTQRLRAMPTRLSPELVVMTDRQECIDFLAEEFDKLLAEIQDELAKV